MKKLLAWLLIGASLLGLWGCAPAAAETVPAAAESSETVTQPTEAATEALSEENLYLTVSSITFSLVGETEDIYLGLVPRDQVTWESDDPTVVSVENGILTANGVGTTTIRAVCGDRQVSCTAGCLAETPDQLQALGYHVLTKPKRLIPEVDMDAPCTFYDHSVLLGDSIALMMVQEENKGNYLGDLLFLARGGTSISGLVYYIKNIYYQGKETKIEDALAASGADRVYILLGSNDIADPANRELFFDNIDTLLERIREKTPGIEVVMISNIPKCSSVMTVHQERREPYNVLIPEYNSKMKDYCREHDCMYLDLYCYIEDHCANMAQEYNIDGYHMNELGYMTWMKVMRYYAQYELDGGSLVQLPEGEI